MDDKEKKIETLHHHQAVIDMALSINDYRLAYLDSLYASLDASEIAKLELDKKEADHYSEISAMLEKQAAEYLKKLHLTPEEESRIIPRKPAKGFSEFAGLDSVKDYLMADVVSPWKENRMGKRDKSGLFFFGPSGTGKAAFVQSLVHEMDATGYVIYPLRSFSIYNTDDAVAHIRQLFEMAEKKGDVAFIFSSPEYFFPKGDEEESKVKRKLFLKLFQKEMKRAKKKNFRMLFIMTTDYPDEIAPEALAKGMFDDFIQIHHPNRVTREKMMRERLKDYEIPEENLIPDLVKKTHGYVNKELSRLLRQIKQMADLYKKPEEKPVIDHVIVKKVMDDFHAEDNEKALKSEANFLASLSEPEIIHGF